MKIWFKKYVFLILIVGLYNLPVFADLSDYDLFIGSEYWAMDYTYSRGGLSYKPLIMAIEMRKNFTERNINAGFRIYSGKDDDFHTDFIQAELLCPLIDNKKSQLVAGFAWLSYYDRVTGSSPFSQNFQSLGIKLASRTCFSPVFNAYVKLYQGLLNWGNPQLSSSDVVGYDLGLGLYFEEAGEALYALGYRSNAYNAKDTNGSGASKATSGFYIQVNILIQ